MYRQQYEDDNMEIVHLYVVPEHHQHQSNNDDGDLAHKIVHRVVQWLAICLLMIFILLPGTPVYATKIVSVPAHFLVQKITASAAIVPTGSRVIPATSARGTLTIYNGSVLQESLPTGFIVTTRTGVEIMTDHAVTIPAAQLPQAGVATVPAHAVVAGIGGNIAAFAIHQDDGSSLVIENLHAFTGGQDARTEQYVTSADTTRALDQARSQASARVPSGLQAQPCRESDSIMSTLATVTLSCQFVTYTAPRGVQVLSVLIVGDRVVLRVQEIELPQ